MAESCSSIARPPKKSTKLTITDVADDLIVLIQYLECQYQEKCISDYDMVGTVILLYLACLNPGSWTCGKLKEAVSREYLPSIKLSQLPSTIISKLDESYMIKKFGFKDATMLYDKSVMDIYNTFQFYGVKKNNDNFINITMVNWSLGRRPYTLLSYIPYPMEVLRQQCQGTRVITLFRQREELVAVHKAKLYYMESYDAHGKDSLDFTLHDMKHMEMFADPEIYEEQVGFCRCLLALGHPAIIELASTLLRDDDFTSTSFPSILSHIDRISWKDSSFLSSCKPKKFFLEVLSFDEQLWRELEYVISDM